MKQNSTILLCGHFGKIVTVSVHKTLGEKTS